MRFTVVTSMGLCTKLVSRSRVWYSQNTPCIVFGEKERNSCHCLIRQWERTSIPCQLRIVRNLVGRWFSSSIGYWHKVTMRFSEPTHFFSVCLAPIYGTEPKWLLLAELVEHYKLQVSIFSWINFLLCFLICIDGFKIIACSIEY